MKLSKDSKDLIKCVVLGLLLIFVAFSLFNMYKNLKRRSNKYQNVDLEYFDPLENSNTELVDRNIMKLLNRNNPNVEYFQNDYNFVPRAMSGEYVGSPAPADPDHVELMGEHLGMTPVKEGLEFKDPDTDRTFDFGVGLQPQVEEVGPDGRQSA